MLRFSLQSAALFPRNFQLKRLVLRQARAAERNGPGNRLRGRAALPLL